MKGARQDDDELDALQPRVRTLHVTTVNQIFVSVVMEPLGETVARGVVGHSRGLHFIHSQGSVSHALRLAMPTRIKSFIIHMHTP